MRPLVLMVLILAGGCRCDRGVDRDPQGATGTPVKGAKTADDCKLFLEKSRRAMTAMAIAAGMSYTPAIEAQALVDCRADLAAGQRNQLIDCVLGARDEKAVQACFPRYDELTRSSPEAATGAGSAAGSAEGSGR